MKKSIPALVILVLLNSLSAYGSIDFDEYFIDKTMRIDYYQTGDSDELTITIDQIYKQGSWAGNPDKTIQTVENGSECVKIYSVATNELIYSRCLSSIYSEYKTTIPAKRNVKKTYLESALVPYPKKPVYFVFEERDRQNFLYPVFREKIDPADPNIIKDKPNKNDKFEKILDNGDPHNKVDMAFIAEGYTEGEWEKFVKDVNRYAEVLFTVEPFKSSKDKFNIYAVFRPSSDRGVDEPREGLFRNTVLSAAYNALALDRYLLVDDLKAMHDVASSVPYDFLIVLANTSRYGGGGIYNNYTIFTSDNNRSESIFLHEFGHGFGGLADEYYGATVSYDEFYAPGVEPLEANITALLDPNNVKWKNLLTPGIPVPTPWGKEETEALQAERQENSRKIREDIARLEKEGESEENIGKIRSEFSARNKEIDRKIREIREKYQEMYKGKIGVFEGAGYSSKGLYRSEVVGGVSSGTRYGYGLVSEDAIRKVIEHFSD